MTVLLEDICRNLSEKNCLITGGLKKDGCKVKMANAPTPRLVIDFDRPGSPLAKSTTRCDYLLVADGENPHRLVVVLELKRGMLHVDKVVRQLQAGACVAEKLVPQSRTFKFLPIAVVGKLPKYERGKLKDSSAKVKFNGRAEKLRMMRCEQALGDLLRQLI